MVGFHNALRNFRTGNLDVHDAGTLTDVIEAIIQRTGARHNTAESVSNRLSQSAYGDLPGQSSSAIRSSTPVNTSTANASGESGSTSFSVGDQLGGSPLQQENETVKAGHGFEWQTRHLTTMHKMYVKPETGSYYFKYIPWENLTVCHSYHDVLSAFKQVQLWKPESAEVKFTKGVVRLLPAPGQNGVPPEQNRNVKDAKLIFFDAGEASPLNLTVFENRDDINVWNNLQLNTNPSKKYEPPSRAIWYGLCKEGADLLQYWDPCVYEMDIGENNFHTKSWNHHLHIDSPPRKVEEIFNLYCDKYFNSAHSVDVVQTENQHQFPHDKSAETGGYHGVKCGIDDDIKYYPRFDYFRGFVMAPRTPFYSFYENLNVFTANQSCMDASSYSSLLVREHYDPDRIDIAYHTDWGGKLVESNTRGLVHIKSYDWRANADQRNCEYAPVRGAANWTRCQPYFERNAMRPILFQMKPEYLDGNLIPMECYLEVQIKHTFKVLIEKRYNAPNEEKFRLISKVPTAGRDPPEGSKLPKADFNIIRDDQLVVNIPVKYYLATTIQGTYQGKKLNADHILDTNCNVYTPAVYPLITGRKFLANPKEPHTKSNKRHAPQRLDENIPDKRIRLE